MDFEKVIAERYSVRKFKSQPIEQEKLDKILRAGQIAPTAKNQQAIKFYVVQSEVALAKLRPLTPCHYGAPVVVICCYDNDKTWHDPQNPNRITGDQDVSIVATHMMLEAYNQGLGSCWVDMVDIAGVKRVFNLSANIVPVFILDIGYADAEPAPLHTATKPINEIFEVL